MENWHIQPSELDALPFYEYEISVEEYEKILKERKEEQNKQQSSYDTANPSKMSSNMLRQAQSSMKVPKMTMPRF